MKNDLLLLPGCLCSMFMVLMCLNFATRWSRLFTIINLICSHWIELYSNFPAIYDLYKNFSCNFSFMLKYKHRSITFNPIDSQITKNLFDSNCVSTFTFHDDYQLSFKKATLPIMACLTLVQLKSAVFLRA